MIRWKVINSLKAEELGIREICPNDEGFIEVDLAKIPHGQSLENVLNFAERMGIILKIDTQN